MSGCCSGSGDNTGGGSPARPARRDTRLGQQPHARRETGLELQPPTRRDTRLANEEPPPVRRQTGIGGSGPSAPVPANARVIRQPTIEAGTSRAGDTAGGSSRAPVITITPMSDAEANAAITAITKALVDTEYAFIGGLALRILGYKRDTADADILVENGNAGVVARALEAFGSFGVEQNKKSYRVWFTAPTGKSYNVDVMEPAKLDMRWPTDPEAIMTVTSATYRGAKYLKPALLLESKAISWEGRGEDKREKKLKDQRDMVALANIMVRRRETCPRGRESSMASGVVGVMRRTDPDAARDALFAQIGLGL